LRNPTAEASPFLHIGKLHAYFLSSNKLRTYAREPYIMADIGIDILNMTRDRLPEHVDILPLPEINALAKLPP
jgi:hypothetical protein